MDENNIRVFKQPAGYGKIEVVKGGVFTRDNGEKYICENGHKNPVDSSFCEKCGVNMKGMTEER